jgi:hypothetical protein
MLQGSRLPVCEARRQLVFPRLGAGFQVAVIACLIAAPSATFSREITIYVAPRPATAVHAVRFDHAPSDADAPAGSRAHCP